MKRYYENSINAHIVNIQTCDLLANKLAQAVLHIGDVDNVTNLNLGGIRDILKPTNW